MPDQMAEKPPAKKPYVAAKVMRSGSLVAKPQSRKTESVAPAVEIAITVVT